MRFLSTTFPNAPVHPTRLYFLTSPLRDFPQIGSKGTEDLSCELGAWKRCFCNLADQRRSCLITKWQ